MSDPCREHPPFGRSRNRSGLFTCTTGSLCTASTTRRAPRRQSRVLFHGTFGRFHPADASSGTHRPGVDPETRIIRRRHRMLFQTVRAPREVRRMEDPLLTSALARVEMPAPKWPDSAPTSRAFPLAKSSSREGCEAMRHTHANGRRLHHAGSFFPVPCPFPHKT